MPRPRLPERTPPAPHRSADDRLPGGRTVSALLLLGLAGLLVRSFRLTHQSFWNDEILTIANAGGSLWDVLGGARDHNILPLYYLSIHGILPFEHAELWLRLASVLFGTLSIPVLYLVLRRWGDTALALTGAALLTFAPFHVWYSQEARPYALLLLLSLVALHRVQLAIERPSRARRAAAAAMAAATFYCHTIALGFLLFLGAYVLLVTPRHRWGEWVRTAFAAALLLVPGLLRLFLVPPVGSADVYKPVTVWSLGYLAWAFGTGYSLGPSTTEVLRDPPLQVVTASLATIGVVGGILCALLVAGAVGLRRQPLAFRAVVAWLVLPIGFALAGALGTVHPLNVRYAMLAFPAYLTLLAAGLRAVRGRWPRTVACCALAGVGLWSLHNYFFESRYWRDDNRSAGRFLTSEAQVGDLILATAGYTAQNLRYYYRGLPVSLVAYPADGGEPVLVQGPGLAPVVVGARYVVPRAVPTHMVRLTAGHDRLWVFASRSYHSDPEGRIPGWLDRRFCLSELRRWPGVELRLYVRPLDGGECPTPTQRAGK